MHGLTRCGLWENVQQFLPRHMLKLFRLQFLLVQRADEHQIGELLDHGQGICDTARPNVGSYFINFFNNTYNHGYTSQSYLLSFHFMTFFPYIRCFYNHNSYW